MGIVKSLYQFLFTLSPLELGRVKSAHPDPRAVGDFRTLEDVIAHSLKVPTLVRTQTVAGTPLPKPEKISRTFQDEAIMKRLLQHRDQIPLSGRIIRQ